MTMIDNGVQGAKRQAMKTDPLLALCQEVYSAKPKRLDPIGPAMVKRFRDALEEHPERDEMMATIIEYYWVNAIARITKKAPTKAERAVALKERLDRRERVKHEITMKLDAKVNMMFLDMVLANGKTLRACTKRELIALRPKQDKVFDGIIAALKKPSDVVGATFKTNEELARFWKPAKK